MSLFNKLARNIYLDFGHDFYKLSIYEETPEALSICKSVCVGVCVAKVETVRG